MVVILSVLVILLGLAMIAECIVFQYKQTVFNQGDTKTDQVKKFATSSFGVLIGFSGLAVLTGICGVTCLAKKCTENRAWTFIYGFSLVFVWIVIAIMGIILTAVSFNGPDVIQAFCDGQIQNSQLKFLSNQIQEVDNSLNTYINSYMCS